MPIDRKARAKINSGKGAKKIQLPRRERYVYSISSITIRDSIFMEESVF